MLIAERKFNSFYVIVVICITCAIAYDKRKVQDKNKLGLL